MRKITFTSLACGILSVLLWQCANTGMPSGGPKDITPPLVIKTTPAANSLNFNKKEVTIEFNELIQLKKLNEQFVTSPPFNKAPTVEARGSKLLIEFKEDLQANTTYTLDFADAIADNNEGNLLKNYSFSFSTGKVVDTLMIAGNVWDAADLSPSSGVQVLLHENLNDSAVQKLVPVRLAKTDIFGRFTIKNVKPGKYRLYALEDANRNYKFDQPGEFMAWSDVLVEPSIKYVDVTDSTNIDSVVISQKAVYMPDSLGLFLFKHINKQQYLISNNRKEKGKLTFIFNTPLTQKAQIYLTGHQADENPFIMERNLSNDTITFWMKNKLDYDKDSISISLNYPALDSIGLPIIKQDTMAMYFFKKEEPKKKKKKDDDEEPTPTLSINNLKSSIDIFKTFNFSLTQPAIEFNIEAVKLYTFQDTIPIEQPFTLIQDTMNVRNYAIDSKWELDKQYLLQIDSAAITDIYELNNKKLEARFSIKPMDTYGIIYARIEEPEKDWLIEVINSNGIIVQRHYVPQNGKAGFRYLYPAEYMLRIVVDTNKNGKWDTGDYYTKTQPETVYYYPNKVQVRANWEHELDTWNPKTFKADEFSRKYRKATKKE